jgi:predicted dehydrogenase
VADKMRWAILGTGKIARVLADAIGHTDDGALVAVGSRTAERAEAFAAELGVPGHGTYEDVIADPDVDVVYVASHHPAHRALAVAASQAGRHVLCEKPMAVTGSDAAVIVDAARRNDVFLLEAFAYRAHPQTQRLVELLREGRIGEVRMIDATFGYDAGPTPKNYLFDHELAGGGILDVGCYTTSMSHLIVAAATGASVVEPGDVSGSADIGPSGVDLSAAATLAFEGGILARLACSIRANLASTVSIAGSEGRITVPSPWLPGRIGTEATIVVERWGAETESIDIPLDADLYTLEVEAVHAAISAGERSAAIMPWEDSLANMRTLDRWRAAVGLRFADDGSS